MKAVRVLEYGGQLVFDDVPTPTIARDEILVKIKSTAANHLDLVEASGTARQILPIDLPWIPGHEFSGVVEQIGTDVAAYAPGDAVFAANEMGGTYGEYLAVKAAAIAKKPSNLSFEEAASVPVASQTAWQGIFTHGHLEKGQTILIHGGAGAVGAYAVQLASHAGATVIATASGDDEAYLSSIGASRVIDYRAAPFEQVLCRRDAHAPEVDAEMAIELGVLGRDDRLAQQWVDLVVADDDAALRGELADHLSGAGVDAGDRARRVVVERGDLRQVTGVGEHHAAEDAEHRRHHEQRDDPGVACDPDDDVSHAASLSVHCSVALRRRSDRRASASLTVPYSTFIVD